MINTASTDHASYRFRMLSEDQIQDILRATFDVMRTVGFKILHTGARKMLKQAGAIVRDEIVKVPEHIAMACLSSAPKGWAIFDRNGNRAMEVTGRKSHYGTSTASPNTIDARTGQFRKTLLDDIGIGARVADALENIDFIMPFGSSQDVPGEACDIYEFPITVSNTTKPQVVISYSGRGVELVCEMAAAVVGGLERLQERPFVMAYPEPICPMVYPDHVIDRIFAAADLGMPQIPGASVSLGASGPVTATGAHAEVAQYLDMPTWGLAGATDSKLLDAQAGTEATFHIMAQALAGLNLIHDVGYTDSAMACSARQLVFGNEVIGMVKHFMQGVTVTPETIARDLIEAVGPGGQYLDQMHTVKNFRSSLWHSKLMNRQPREKWLAAGAKDLSQVVQEELNRILDEHQAPGLDDKIMDELERIRKRGEKELIKRKQPAPNG